MHTQIWKSLGPEADGESRWILLRMISPSSYLACEDIYEFPNGYDERADELSAMIRRLGSYP